jgi:hypothetical protein
LNALAVTTARAADGVVESSAIGIPVPIGTSTGSSGAASAVGRDAEPADSALQVIAARQQPLAAIRGRAIHDRSSATALGGVDYTDAPVTPDVTSCEPGIFYTTKPEVTGGYVVVGEAHAYYDAWASFDYESTAGTSMSVGVSYNMGASFSASGSSYIGNSFGFGSGYDHQGPYFARQWKAPMLIQRYQVWERCTGGDQYVKDVIQTTAVSTWPGGSTGMVGADVSAKDGPTAYSKAAAANRTVVARNTYFFQLAGQTESYANAVTAWGFGLTATTDYSSIRRQRIDAGAAAVEHDIWGLDGPPGSPSARVFYSY